MDNLLILDETKNIKDLSKEELRDLQSALSKFNYKIEIDGIYGKETKNVFNQFKKDNNLTYPDLIGSTTVNFILNKLKNKSVNINKDFSFLKKPEIINGKKVIVKMPPNWQQKKLSISDFEKLGDLFNLEKASIQAVMEIESSGSGFLLNEIYPARPKILFEGHIFYRQTVKPVSKTRPDLSHSSWTKKYYKGGSAEWERLLDAMEFDPIAAVKSASWGLGQIMGFNYELLGYSHVEDMIIDCHKGEYYQAKQIFNFCSNHPSGRVIKALKNKDWRTFAYFYNGESYQRNNYDVKLHNAYLKYSIRK